MDTKQKKKIIRDYLQSDKATPIEKDTIKLLWGRIPKPYGIKFYKAHIVIDFD